jgi:hypothetical protein
MSEAQRMPPLRGKSGPAQPADSGGWGPRTAVVSLQELGTNCWLPKRFIQGGRCARVMECNYPEKAKCKAVQAEVDFLNREIFQVQKRALERIQMLGQSIIELQQQQKKSM